MAVEAPANESAGYAVVRAEDCFGGGRIVEVVAPRGPRLDELDRIEGVGTRTVLDQLPRPFFRLDVPARFLLVGVVGDPKLRFTFRQAFRDEADVEAVRVARVLLADAAPDLQLS